jgi:hypothetical protein
VRDIVSWYEPAVRAQRRLNEQTMRIDASWEAGSAPIAARGGEGPPEDQMGRGGCAGRE